MLDYSKELKALANVPVFRDATGIWGGSPETAPLLVTLATDINLKSLTCTKHLERLAMVGLL
jgi:hypothetical protein